MLVRVQRKRTKGYRLPPNTVSVCRPGMPCPCGTEIKKAGGTISMLGMCVSIQFIVRWL